MGRESWLMLLCRIRNLGIGRGRWKGYWGSGHRIHYIILEDSKHIRWSDPALPCWKALPRGKSPSQTHACFQLFHPSKCLSKQRGKLHMLAFCIDGEEIFMDQPNIPPPAGRRTPLQARPSLYLLPAHQKCHPLLPQQEGDSRYCPP